jgi:hypothetical protein
MHVNTWVVKTRKPINKKVNPTHLFMIACGCLAACFVITTPGTMPLLDVKVADNRIQSKQNKFTN